MLVGELFELEDHVGHLFVIMRGGETAHCERVELFGVRRTTESADAARLGEEALLRRRIDPDIGQDHSRGRVARSRGMEASV